MCPFFTHAKSNVVWTGGLSVGHGNLFYIKMKTVTIYLYIYGYFLSQNSLFLISHLITSNSEVYFFYGFLIKNILKTIAYIYENKITNE